MSNPEIKVNRKQTDPKLKDLLDLQKRDILLSLNCHHIATVQSFDSATQTIKATINYKKTVLEQQADGTYSNVLIPYPTLIDVPVIIIGGGAFRATFPITAGDACLIMFNDRNMDNWLQSGQVAGNASPRLHSFADGIALVGLYPSSTPLDNYDVTHGLIRNGNIKVGVSATKVLAANATTTLGVQLQSTFTALDTMLTAFAAATTVAQIATASGTAKTALAAIKTQLAGLLE